MVDPAESSSGPVQVQYILPGVSSCPVHHPEAKLGPPEVRSGVVAPSETSLGPEDAVKDVLRPRNSSLSKLRSRRSRKSCQGHSLPVHPAVLAGLIKVMSRVFDVSDPDSRVHNKWQMF